MLKEGRAVVGDAAEIFDGGLRVNFCVAPDT